MLDEPPLDVRQVRLALVLRPGLRSAPPPAAYCLQYCEFRLKWPFFKRKHTLKKRPFQSKFDSLAACMAMAAMHGALEPWVF